jgi:thiamine biosynthesis lipoprotein
MKKLIFRLSPMECLLRCLGLVGVLLLGGCQSPTAKPVAQRFEFQQPHMGTLFTITLYATNEVSAQGAAAAAFAKVAALNQMMTDYDPESELMQLCRVTVGEPARVSAELFAILAESQRVAELSAGAFDPTIGPVVRLWRRVRRTEALPSPEQLAHARESVGWRKLQLDSKHQTVTLLATNMQLDLGGIAKGYAADAALKVLREHGMRSALVAASGDIAVGDTPPGQVGWRVSIGKPFQSADKERTLILKNVAVSTSGDSEQFVVIAGKHYSHIVDPRTGMGLTNRCQVSIIAPHATQTDALATAVSILGAEQGAALVKSEPRASAIIYRETSTGIETIEVNR